MPACNALQSQAGSMHLMTVRHAVWHKDIQKVSGNSPVTSINIWHSGHGVDLKSGLDASRCFPAENDGDVAKGSTHGVVGSHGQVKLCGVAIYVLPIL